LGACPDVSFSCGGATCADIMSDCRTGVTWAMVANNWCPSTAGSSGSASFTVAEPKPAPWCYTTNLAVPWELCSQILECSPPPLPPMPPPSPPPSPPPPSPPPVPPPPSPPPPSPPPSPPPPSPPPPPPDFPSSPPPSSPPMHPPYPPAEYYDCYIGPHQIGLSYTALETELSHTDAMRICMQDETCTVVAQDAVDDSVWHTGKDEIAELFSIEKTRFFIKSGSCTPSPPPPSPPPPARRLR